jgi:hypothetical protein
MNWSILNLCWPYYVIIFESTYKLCMCDQNNVISLKLHYESILLLEIIHFFQYNFH